MEYVFGTKKDKEILKTKGTSHSGLSGFHTLERKYPDQTLTDSFRIVGLLDSKEDSEGNCYDWYEIDHHNRYTDKFTPAKEEIKSGISENQEAVLDIAELSDENSSAIVDLAEMVEELTERVGTLEA